MSENGSRSGLNLLSLQPSTDEARTMASGGNSARSASRRKRTSFSKKHVELLRATFETDPYPGISLREGLSQATGLPESRIQVGRNFISDHDSVVKNTQNSEFSKSKDIMLKSYSHK